MVKVRVKVGESWSESEEKGAKHQTTSSEILIYNVRPDMMNMISNVESYMVK